MGRTSDLDVRISAYAEGLPYANWRPWGTPGRPASGWVLPGFLQEMRNARRRPTIIIEGPSEAAKEAARRITDLLENPPATGAQADADIRRGMPRLLGRE